MWEKSKKDVETRSTTAVRNYGTTVAISRDQIADKNKEELAEMRREELKRITKYRKQKLLDNESMKLNRDQLFNSVA